MGSGHDTLGSVLADLLRCNPLDNSRCEMLTLPDCGEPVCLYLLDNFDLQTGIIAGLIVFVVAFLLGHVRSMWG